MQEKFDFEAEQRHPKHLMTRGATQKAKENINTSPIILVFL